MTETIGDIHPGATVTYHGRLDDDHGTYTADLCTCPQCKNHYGTCPHCHTGDYAACDAAGGGGLRYVLTDPDDPHHVLKHAGRRSITPTE